MYYLSKRSFRNLNGVDAIIVAVLVEAIKYSPYDFGIANDGGLRTLEEQKELYSIGRRDVKGEETVTNCDGVEKKSDHQLGKAIDYYGYVNGKLDYNKGVMQSIAMHIINVGKEKFGVTLYWGGKWKSPDMPHLYYKSYK